MPTVPFDLKARARQAMLEAGFQPDFPPNLVREVQTRMTGRGTLEKAKAVR